MEGWKGWEELETCLIPYSHLGLRFRIDLYVYRKRNAIGKPVHALVQGVHPVELRQVDNRKAYMMIIYRKRIYEKPTKGP